MIKVLTIITLKKNVTDTHGAGVLSSLKLSGFDNVNDIRYGKQFVITLDDTDREVAKKKVEEMCEKLLANSYIEEYEVKIVENKQ